MRALPVLILLFSSFANAGKDVPIDPDSAIENGFIFEIGKEQHEGGCSNIHVLAPLTLPGHEKEPRMEAKFSIYKKGTNELYVSGSAYVSVRELNENIYHDIWLCVPTDLEKDFKLKVAYYAPNVITCDPDGNSCTTKVSGSMCPPNFVIEGLPSHIKQLITNQASGTP